MRILVYKSLKSINLFLWLSCSIYLFPRDYLLDISINFRSKQNNYDEVVEYVARRLGLDDASKIRLTSHNCYSQQPKPQPIKYRGAERLTDMLIHYNQVVYDCDIKLVAFSVDFCLVRVCLLTTAFHSMSVEYIDFRYTIL